MATIKRNVIVSYQDEHSEVKEWTLSYVNPAIATSSVYSAVHDIFDFSTATVLSIYTQDTTEIFGGE